MRRPRQVPLTERVESYLSRPTFAMTAAYADGEPVGQAFGCNLTGSGPWDKMLTRSPTTSTAGRGPYSDRNHGARGHGAGGASPAGGRLLLAGRPEERPS
jgi:hypothetical protein